MFTLIVKATLVDAKKKLQSGRVDWKALFTGQPEKLNQSVERLTVPHISAESDQVIKLSNPKECFTTAAPTIVNSRLRTKSASKEKTIPSAKPGPKGKTIQSAKSTSKGKASTFKAPGPITSKRTTKK